MKVNMVKNSEHIGLIYTIAFDLIQNNSLCKKVIGNSPDEYLGVGYIALQKAIKNFDSKIGVQFATYATQVIKDQIIKFARKNATLIKVASSYRYQAWRVKNGKNQTQGNQKSVLAAQRIVDGKITPLSLFSIGKEQLEEDWIKKEYIADIIRKLDERTQMIIKLRYGLNCQRKTLEDIGNLLIPKLSRERVRQLEKEGLLKLQKLMDTK